MLKPCRCGGSIGKLVRLKAVISDNPSINQDRSFPFLLLDGLIADLTPWMHCGGHGTVSGIPNFAPVTTMKLWNLLNNPFPTREEVTDATKLQAILSRADVAAVPAGVRGMSKSSPSNLKLHDPDIISRVCLAQNARVWRSSAKTIASIERGGRRRVHVGTKRTARS